MATPTLTPEPPIGATVRLEPDDGRRWRHTETAYWQLAQHSNAYLRLDISDGPTHLRWGSIQALAARTGALGVAVDLPKER